ncbi:hypothetical protein SAMN05661096_02878 [Marivirga sericea]|uniref:Glycosyl transferases group 1 n=1 Tax=Marivirga sericea TaxID=1028 RepID=A0A1X7KLB5_9BACT|nr:hypothetical protein [Marivirga sericea]SMG42254.1 hypothetical protein SAMN05661096_02878 [Marivirga sericea]
MHLSDPWTINKVNTVRKKDHLWEKRCLELADIVTFTNQEIITAYSKIYPQFTDKFKLFTNAYKNGEEAIKYRIADSFTIVHTGNLYKPKDPKIFLTAYKAFLESLDKTARKHVNCIFVGHVDEEIKKNTLGFGENLELRSQISFEEALELQKNADLLLNVGVNLPNRTDDLFFQSKLVDYMTARRPILAITGIDSPTYKFVNSGYGKAFSFSDFDGILKFLKAIYNKKDFELAPVDPTYSVANNVENLISWFNVLKNE